MYSVIIQRMIKVLIMDADGVLVTKPETFSVILAREYKINPKKVLEFFDGNFQDCLIGKADLKESVAPYLKHFNWPGTVDEFLDYWFKSEHYLHEGLIEYIKKLRRQSTTIVLATNQEKYRTQYMLEHMGFADVFEKIYSSAHLGLKKPAVEFFAKVVEDLGANKDEVLFWDDDQQNIDGALQYGINAEFYTGYDSFLEKMERYGFSR